MGPALRWSDGSTGARRPSHDEAGNNKHFIEVWLRNSIQVDRMREQEMLARDWIRMDMMKFA